MSIFLARKRHEKLENVIERSVVICDDEFIRPQHLLLVSGLNEDNEYENKNLKDASEHL